MTALYFPASPSNGDTYENYVYDATAGVWKRLAPVRGQIGGLEDVTITSPTNEQVLLYSDGEWVNGEVFDIGDLKNPLACKATFVSVDFNSSASYAKVSSFNTTALLNETGFSLSSSGITVPSAGLYFVSFNIELTSTGQRVAPIVALGVNDSVDTSLVAAHTYIRATDGHNTTSANASGLVRLDADDVVELFARRGSNTTTATNSTAGIGSFNIYRVGD